MNRTLLYGNINILGAIFGHNGDEGHSSRRGKSIKYAMILPKYRQIIENCVPEVSLGLFNIQNF